MSLKTICLILRYVKNKNLRMKRDKIKLKKTCRRKLILFTNAGCVVQFVYSYNLYQELIYKLRNNNNIVLL